MRALLLIVVAVLGFAAAAVNRADTGTGVDPDGLPPRIDYQGDLSHDCQGPAAVNVVPDTPDAWAAANRKCERLDLGLGAIPWPEGVRP